MAGFFAGSLLLLLPARTGWTLYGAMTLSLLVPGLLDNRSVIDMVYMCQSTALTGLVVYGLSRLTSSSTRCTGHAPIWRGWPSARSGCASRATCTICSATASRRSH